MKQFKGTFILAGLALVVGLYIYFVEIKKKENDEKAKEANEKVFSLSADKVKALKIKNSFGDFELEKGDKNEWVIKFPLADSADQVALSSIVTNLLNEKYDEVVSETETDLKPYGLDQPKLTITMSTGETGNQTLLVGGDGAIPGKIYVKRDGESKVLFANNSIKTQIDKPLKDLRDKRIFRGSRDEISQIVLKNHRKDNNQQITLEKKDGQWHITSPVTEEADKDSVQAIMTSITDNLKAVDFPSEGGTDKKNLKKFMLDNPEVQITLSDKDKKVLETIVVGSPKDKNHYAYAMGKAPIYMVAQPNVDAVVKKVDDFRDKTKPFKFKKEDVKQLTLKTGMVDVNLVKKDSNWELSNPDDKKQVNQLQVSNLLEKLSSMKVADFLASESPKGLSKPKGLIELKAADGKELYSFAWGEKTKTLRNYYVRTSLVEKPVGVEATLIESLPAQTLLQEKPKADESKSAPAPVSKADQAPTDPALPSEPSQ